MATSREDIKNWLADAKPSHTHMIVVCDTFDHTDYPVYVHEAQSVLDIYHEYNGINMKHVIEVYNLRIDLEVQLLQPRAFNF